MVDLMNTGCEAGIYNPDEIAVFYKHIHTLVHSYWGNLTSAIHLEYAVWDFFFSLFLLKTKMDHV